MECNKQRNLKSCNCTYASCPRKGLCCECISYHRRNLELPACVFPDSIEQTYDRSFRTFAEAVMNDKNQR